MSEPNYFSEHPPVLCDPQRVHIRILAEGWGEMRSGTLKASQGRHVRQLSMAETGKMLKLAATIRSREAVA